MRHTALFCALALAVFAPLATAQDVQPRREFDLSALQGPSDPAWRGSGGFEPLQGASLRITTGTHAVGDVVVELDVAPRRTARLTADIALIHDANGAQTIAAGTLLYAMNTQLFATGPGTNRPRYFGEGNLYWCTLEPPEVRICISHEGDEAYYRVDGDGMPRWVGPLPSIIEQPLSPLPRFVRQWAVREITADTVSLETTISRDGARWLSEGVTRPLAFGTVVRGGETLGSFRVTRARNGRVRVEAQ